MGSTGLCLRREENWISVYIEMKFCHHYAVDDDDDDNDDDDNDDDDRTTTTTVMTMKQHWHSYLCESFASSI